MTAMSATGGDNGARRFATAFVVSLLCHSLVLVGARGWRLESGAVAPLVVTMLEPGPDGAGSGPARASVEVGAPPREAAAAPPRPSVVQRAAPVRPPQPRAPAVPRVPDVGTARSIAAASTDALAHATSAGSGADVGGGNDGASSVGPGPGARGGGGSGSDGLRAFCASCPAPEYPGRARRQGWQGTVDVELAIARDGGVTEARIGRSSGYPALDEVALGAARRSRFAVPASGDGLRGQLRYRFLLDATAAQR